MSIEAWGWLILIPSIATIVTTLATKTGRRYWFTKERADER